MEEFNLPTHHFLQVLQYSDFISKTCPKKNIRFQKSFLDKLLAKYRHSITDIYHPLNEKFTKPIHKTSIKSWIADGQANIENILKSYRITRNIIPNESWRETQFKLMHRAYYPFSSKLPSTTGASCPWCSLHKPSLLHHLWLCSRINIYWFTILKFIQEAANFQPEKDPMLLFFGYPPTKNESPISSNIIPQENLQWTLLMLLIAHRNIFTH